MTEPCAVCGDPVSPEIANPREGDRGPEYVCDGCRFLTIDQTAERIGTGRATVHKMARAYKERWRAEGRSAYDPPEPLPGTELPCIYIGPRKLRIPVAGLERMGL